MLNALYDEATVSEFHSAFELNIKLMRNILRVPSGASTKNKAITVGYLLHEFVKPS